MDTNGSGEAFKLSGDVVVLPPGRMAIVEQGNRIAQETAAERDALAEDNFKLRQELTLLKVAAEGDRAEINRLESRVQEAYAKRDEAVAHRAIYEAFYTMQHAQFRAFKIPVAPLVQGTDEAEQAHVGLPASLG